MFRVIDTAIIRVSQFNAIALKSDDISAAVSGTVFSTYISRQFIQAILKSYLNFTKTIKIIQFLQC